MKALPLSTIALVGMLVAAQPVAAACYADYKAKQDNPLRLHYGVVELPEAACRNPARALAAVRARVEAAGWDVLNVVSTFDASGLEQRRESAGPYFLRF